MIGNVDNIALRKGGSVGEKIPLTGGRADSGLGAPSPTQRTILGDGARTELPLGPKKSWAIPLWFGITTAVLATLWFQMQVVSPSYNFLIEGNRNADGATVLLDGRSIGSMHETSETGVSMIVLRAQIAGGEHLVEVQKPGFTPSKMNFKMTREEYLDVRLTPATQR